MTLKEILYQIEKMCDSSKFENHLRGIGIEQAHSDILKWIEERLPPELPFTSIGKTTDGFVLGHNQYRHKALKNLGIKQ